MPELPDVEGFRRTLAEHGEGRRIERVEVLDAGVLHGVTPAALATALSGHRLRPPYRHGKVLLAPTDGPVLLLHFGMTGDLRWSPMGSPRDRYDRAVFATDDGELRYRDIRKLRGLRLAADREAADGLLARLGPDALAISREEFDRLLSERRGAIKAVLVDQHVVAGLGNLLADEILWRARIHPLLPARGLTGAQRARLHREMRRVLRASVRARRVPPRRSWLTGVRDDRHARCPRCRVALSRRRVSGRTTVSCPQCQPA